MEAKELRIGNIISWRNYRGDLLGEKSLITLVCKEGVMVNDLASIPLSEIEPIPLTEEWLIKFGLVKNIFYDTYNLKDYCIDIQDGEFNIMNDRVSDAGCYYITTIKYVHQLQNLFYCLCGEELQMQNL